MAIDAHKPVISRVIDTLNRRIGLGLGWLALALILIQFALVVAGSVFSANSLWLQELRLYLNSLIFLGGAGYTLLANDQVRVDLLYHGADERTRAWVALIGTPVLLWPLLILMGWAAWPTIAASWAGLEGSTEAGGLPFVYVLKSMVLLFVGTLGLQGLSEVVKAWTTLDRGAA